MRRVVVRGWVLGLLAVLAAVDPGCDGEADETVTPVQIRPSDDAPPPPAPSVERLTVRVVDTYPHDRDAFTQGLLWHDGAMYESTGRYGKSTLRKVRLRDGEVLDERPVGPEYFAEGLARVEDRLVQLTWRSGVAFVADLDTLDPQATLRYPGEGWGLCYDGTMLVMSDGSSILEFRDPESMALRREVTVMEEGDPVQRLNELECVDGVVYANIWRSDDIVRIDPETGRVTAVIDASGLLTRLESIRADVLNGIAYRPESKTFLVTGKLWPHVFEVELVPR